jgi:uncharacterized protein (UPF0333 family)
MLGKRGQGTIEYLVIIAIVVVIALVVVGLLLQVMGNSGGASESSVKAAWKSTQPWAITDWIMGSDGNVTIVLRNNSAETLGYNRMQLSTIDLNTGAASNVAPGATKTVVIDVNTYTSTGIASGAKYSFPKAGIYIDYNSTGISNQKQYGVADIVGTKQ